MDGGDEHDICECIWHHWFVLVHLKYLRSSIIYEHHATVKGKFDINGEKEINFSLLRLNYLIIFWEG